MQSNLSQINVHQVREKIGSKKELYDFLTQECNAYLPKKTCTNIYFLKSILNGEKEYIKRNDVIISAVPQIEGLTVEDFIDYAIGKPNLLNFLPDQCDWLHLDKKWICDVLLTLDREGINSMIQEAKLKRRERLDNSSNLIVHMKPEFAQALRNSVNYSVQKGRSAHLIKMSSQRRRKTNQIEEVKQEERDLRQSKQKYLESNKRMKHDFEEIRGQVDDLMNYKELVHQLHEHGIIDGDGNPVQNAQQIREMMN